MKTVARYTQPVIQVTQRTPEFQTAEVDLFEDPKGKWVKYDDIKHLLQNELSAKHAIANGETGWTFHQQCLCARCAQVLTDIGRAQKQEGNA